MKRSNWTKRTLQGFCLALAAISLAGCVVVPGRGGYYHPYYYHR
jgi:hypothetical protein